MGAKILPFPAVRRRSFILKQARFMARQSSKAAEAQLAAQLRLQRETMERRGIAADTVDTEIRALELAIRAELWRVVLTPGGAA